MYNDHDDFLRRIHEQMYAPIIRIQRQLNLMNRNVLQSYNNLNIVGRSLEKTFEIFRQQQEINARAMKYAINETITSQFERAFRVINQMSRIQNFQVAIPDVIYPNIERLIDSIHDDFLDEDESEVDTLEVKNFITDFSNKVLTWETLKWFISLVASVIVTLYIANTTSQQAERHHQEKMDQAERHHQERNDQDLLLIEERMAIYTEFMEFLEPYLPKDQDTAEIENEDLATLD